jgi:hypothetical protein
MSIESLHRVITRALAEPEFRDLLFNHTSQALCDYDLSAAETAMLTGLTPATLGRLASEFKLRQARGAIHAPSPETRESLRLVWGDPSRPVDHNHGGQRPS